MSRRLKFAPIKRKLSVLSLDERNLACAEAILSDREQFSGPGNASIVAWAKRILERLAVKERKPVA